MKGPRATTLYTGYASANVPVPWLPGYPRNTLKSGAGVYAVSLCRFLLLDSAQRAFESRQTPRSRFCFCHSSKLFNCRNAATARPRKILSGCAFPAFAAIALQTLLDLSRSSLRFDPVGKDVSGVERIRGNGIPFAVYVSRSSIVAYA